MLLYRLAKMMEEHARLTTKLEQQPAHPEFEQLARRKADMEEELLNLSQALGIPVPELPDDYVLH